MSTPVPTADVRRVLEDYPAIYFACHERHRRDPETAHVLSARQASILDHLDTVDPTSVGELAEHLGLTSSTVSLALGRLERDGYVARENAPEDARRTDVRLTPAGDRVKAAQSVLEPARVARMLARLGPEEREEGLRGLALLARAARDEVRAGRAKGAGRGWSADPGTITEQEVGR